MTQRTPRSGSTAATHKAVVWPFLLVIVIQMLFAGFSLHMLSAIRAGLTAENLWLQAEQYAVKQLKFYISTGRNEHFHDFKSSMGIPLGYREAALALMANDLRAAEAHFRDVGLPADEASSIVWLFSDFSKVSYVADANRQWLQVNEVVAKMDRLAEDVHAAMRWMTGDGAGSTAWLQRVDELDEETVPLVEVFARSLNTGGRMIERALMIVNLALAIGLSALTIWRVRRFLNQRKAIEAALAWQATHDPLTGIANRRAFESRLDGLTAAAAENCAPFALLVVDLDQFKVVNDTCGHAAGDELLRKIGAALQRELRDSDLLARLGGDEFSILLTDCSLLQAAGVAEAVRVAAQDLAFAWNQRAFRITASIGLVYTDQGLIKTEELMRAADMACYLAKQKGRNRVHLHRPDDQDLMRHAGEMSWVQRIHQALEDNRFCLYAQEIAPLAAEREEGLHVELLIRLRDETGALVPPASFLPAAERFGLMTLIDRWVVRAAFESLAARSADLEAEPIACCAINLSGTTVGDDAFLAFLKQCFAQFAIPPSIICFEITETNAITNLAAARSFVQNLQALGCRFSLDDFGSGMSSFGYLKQLPVDFLKIDGCFVRNLLSDQVDRAMVESINHIGHVMGKRIIAEFVETDGLMAALETIGVDYGQGYGIARPKPFDRSFRSCRATDRALPLRRTA